MRERHLYVWSGDMRNYWVLFLASLDISGCVINCYRGG